MNKEKREFLRQLQDMILRLAGVGFLFGLSLVILSIFFTANPESEHTNRLGIRILWISLLTVLIFDSAMFEKFINAFWPAEKGDIDAEDSSSVPDMWIATTADIRQPERHLPFGMRVILVMLLAGTVVFYFSQSAWIVVTSTAGVVLIILGAGMLWREQ